MKILPGSLKSVLFVVIQFACIITIFISGNPVSSDFLFYAFILIFALPGLWAMYVMKFRFNVAPDVPEGTKMAVKGPYKFIRHPMYTSVLGITLSVVIFNFSYFILMIWVILLINLIMKLSYEEQLLSRRFPEYGEYKLRTKKLIPFLF